MHDALGRPQGGTSQPAFTIGDVVARTEGNVVVAGRGADDVIAAQGANHISPTGPTNHIRIRGAGDRSATRFCHRVGGALNDTGGGHCWSRSNA